MGLPKNVQPATYALFPAQIEALRTLQTRGGVNQSAFMRKAVAEALDKELKRMSKHDDATMRALSKELSKVLRAGKGGD